MSDTAKWVKYVNEKLTRIANTEEGVSQENRDQLLMGLNVLSEAYSHFTGAGRSFLHCLVDMINEEPPDEVLIFLQLLFIDNSELNSLNENGLSPLHLALLNSNIKITKLLLACGADAEQTSKTSCKPLHYALEGEPRDLENMRECVKCLLDHGVDIDAETPSGYTPLHYAIHMNAPEIVKMLLDYGANVNCYVHVSLLKFAKFSQGYSQSYTESALMIAARIMMNIRNGVSCFNEDFETLKVDFSRESAPLKPIIEKYNDDVSLYEEELEKEVGSMKNLKMSGSFSLFDIFKTKNPRYRSNTSLTEALQSINYDEFPEFCDWIRGKIKSDKRYHELIVQAQNSLELLIRFGRSDSEDTPLQQLPQVLIEQIVSHLEIGDLHRLIRSCKISGKKSNTDGNGDKLIMPSIRTRISAFLSRFFGIIFLISATNWQRIRLLIAQKLSRCLALIRRRAII